ncbi:kinase-like domain-containing protein [Mucor mucedo]|uniref:kinase-like domain-containing protein n=1 Tax=Mucor mucedo TaxID=29922 RepID=UPI002220217B|nr:kinase-like domain-containing protein [Mucor mucedo]KAI7882086.1 kinase-like domain-containing protein [Mucor mucedo]
MFSNNNNKCQFNKEKKAVPLHIDTDPLGISFYEKGSTHAIVSPVLLNRQNNLSPFPSPSSSTSSVATCLHESSKSFPTARTDVSRNKCQIHRPSQSFEPNVKMSSKSWETIKSPAASFLASFALSPVNQEQVNDEREGDEIDDYVLDKIIGYGGFATVRKGFRVSDGQKVAIKIIKKSFHTEETDYRLERELSIWKLLDHPHIVRLIKVLETDSATFLICDYCSGGSLLDLLKKPMSEIEARRIFIQLAQAIQYLHEEAKVCHKDLKLENILFDQDNNVKLCDFGLALCQQPLKLNAVTNLPLSPEILDELDCAAGSLAYAAPEQIKSAKAISCPSTDIWSLGVILYALVTAKLPFHDDYDLRLQQKIMQGDYHMPPYLSAELQDLIKSCLSLTPESRFNIDQVLQSRWCTM